MTDTPEPLTADEIAYFKAKAKAATPTEGSTLFRYEHGGGRLFVEHNEKDRTLIIDSYHKGDREFYYAANPETILRLIDMIERRDGQIKKLRQLLARGITIANLDEVSFNTDFVNEAQKALAATESPDAKN